MQFEPVHGQPLQSMEKVGKMLENQSHSDILVLPEMAFLGYTFNDKAEILPLLEEPNSNYATFQWCSQQALRLSSYVFCGYGEKTTENYYNSMMVISPEGQLIENCRKKFLYVTDKTWAVEGEDFKCIEIRKNTKIYKVGLGICMDINPYEFTAPFNKYELATFWKSQNIDLCVFCTNWTSSGPEDNSEDLLNYWVSRLVPLLESEKSTYFIAADRIGTERGTSYMGTSCILKLGNRPQLLKSLDKVSENILEFQI